MLKETFIFSISKTNRLNIFILFRIATSRIQINNLPTQSYRVFLRSLGTAFLLMPTLSQVLSQARVWSLSISSLEKLIELDSIMALSQIKNLANQ